MNNELNAEIAKMLGMNPVLLDSPGFSETLHCVENVDGPHSLIGGYRFLAYADDDKNETIIYWGIVCPNWAGNIRDAWQLMEAMNAIDSPVDWAVFREKLLYEFRLPLGYPEEDACHNICRAILASRKKDEKELPDENYEKLRAWAKERRFAERITEAMALLGYTPTDAPGEEEQGDATTATNTQLETPQ